MAHVTNNDKYSRAEQAPVHNPTGADLRQQLEITNRELRHKTLLLSATLAENRVIRRNMATLSQENGHLLERLSSLSAMEALS